MKKPVLFLTQAAIIAAVYAALTLALPFLSYEVVQVRFSEALTVLPFFTPAAVPGLFVGCIISNLFSPVTVWDIVFGSLATLIAAYLSYRIKNKWLVPLPPVLVNVIIVGPMLSFSGFGPIWVTSLGVLVGQTIACYGVGLILLLALEKAKIPSLKYK